MDNENIILKQRVKRLERLIDQFRYGPLEEGGPYLETPINYLYRWAKDMEKENKKEILRKSWLCKHKKTYQDYYAKGAKPYYPIIYCSICGQKSDWAYWGEHIEKFGEK